jgi:hypothetical protein
VAWVLYYPNAACSATFFGIILFSSNDRIYGARSGGLKLVHSGPACREKTRGEKMKVSSIMLLKTNGGKMSEIGLSIMFMKRKGVTLVFPLY